MKTFCLCLLLIAAASGVALAVSPGQTITFDGGVAGPVVFRSETHRQTCTTCHNKRLFPQMKKGATPINMEAINSGRLCGSCHDGGLAFASQGNCHRCHQGFEK